MADQYDEIEKLVTEGNLAVAELRVVDWLQYHPNDARAWLLYGKCINNPSQKKNCFRRALDLDPSIEEARELLNQIELSLSVVHRSGALSKDDDPLASVPSALSAKSLSNSSILKSPVLDEQVKVNLSVFLYSLFHFILTLALAIVLVFMFSASVPGLLSTNESSDNIQRNWLSSSTLSGANQELQALSDIFLNPSLLDYRTVNTYQELRNLRVSLAGNTSDSQPLEFNGVRFTGQLVGGNVLQNGMDGQPVIILMSIVFDETRIPVVYYGPPSSFKYEDMVMVDGVYIEEPNGVVAQRVERLSTEPSTWIDGDGMLLLRVAGGILLWALICFSVFFWRLNLKKMQREIVLRSPMTGVFLLLILSVSVTGCTIDLSTTLRSDGTGITSILVHESKENMDFLRSAPGVSGYLSAVVREVKKTGAMFEQYVEGDQEIFYIQRYFNNSSTGTGNFYPTEGSWVHVQRYREGNNYVLRFLGAVDTRTLYNNSEGIDTDVAGVLRDQLNQIDMNYHLSVPGTLIYHNGVSENSQQVSWKMQMNDINYLVAETRFPVENAAGFTRYALFIWIGLSVIFVASTLILIRSVWIRPPKTDIGRKT